MRVRNLDRQDGFSLIDMLAAILVVSIVSAMALPMAGSSLAAQRFRGDGQALSNLVALAKMRAAARFSRARLFVNLANNSYSVQVWDKTGGTWVTDGGEMQTSRGVTFGFGGLTAPPPNTQEEIAMSPPCTDDDEALIANTSCIEFNSRGIPIDNAGAPSGGNAFYVTNGTGVYAVTVTATPLVRMWWTSGHAANWVEQQ
jgi:prepilin-type N-terminal cleavage/methylation domain-containing protein